MRKIVTLLLLLVLLIAPSIATLAPVKAEPRTITVPDDYPTIQAAVGNASDGDTVYVKNGIYSGGNSNEWLTINKSISLVGEDNQQTIIRPPRPTFQGQNDYVIEVTADDVTISGIHIQGHSPGIRVARSGDTTPRHIKVLNCFIENCYKAIILFGSDITIDGNYLTQNGRGIENGASNTTISNNLIFKNYVGMLQGSPNGKYYVYGNLISQNYEGGLELLGMGPHYVYNNNVTNNPGYGILFSGSGADVFRNEISFNGVAIKTSSVEGGGTDNYIYGNNFIENSVNSSLADPSTNWMTGAPMQPVDVFLDKNKQGNYWSGYGGNGSYLVGDGLYDYYPLSQPVNIDPLSITSLPTPTPTATPPATPSSALIVEAVLIAMIIVAAAGLLVYFTKRKH
jgi:hypothetical protein